MTLFIFGEMTTIAYIFERNNEVHYTCAIQGEGQWSAAY